MTSGRQILVVGPSWVGDMVMAQSLYRLLRRRYAAAVDVVAPSWSLTVLDRMPEVRRGFELAVGHGQIGLPIRWRLGSRLRKVGYDQAIVLPRSLKAALVPWLARVGRRTGFVGEARYGLINDIRPFDPAVLDQTVKRFVALGLEAGESLAGVAAEVEAPALDVDALACKALCARLGLDTRGDIVAMMPGAEYGSAKQWPVDRFAAAAARLSAAGVTVWVLGSPKERSLGEAIAARGGDNVRNLCGRTSLIEAVDLLGAARVAVTNDSGLMHVAAAVGAHVVAIYGSSSPSFTPPLTDAKTILYLGLECSPCFERTCPLGHLRCLREIGPADVVSAVASALGADGPAGEGIR